jgi:hypothetical protein
MTDLSVHAHPSAEPGRASAAPSAELAQEIAQEAYLYLYPLVLMDLTRRQFTNLDPSVNAFGGPANTFNHVRAFPTAEMRAVVRPNFDTLYSSAWLDLSGGPVIVSTADTHGRYFMLPMLDMWTDVFAAPGARTNGTGAADFAVVPPGWVGTLPQGVQRIYAPTPHVWILGRTQTNGPHDYPAVHDIQDGYRITLLAEWGGAPRKPVQSVDPSVDTSTEPLRQVAAMSAPAFFQYGAELMKLNPPHLTDWSMLARLARIGIQGGKKFDADRVTPSALGNAAVDAQRLMRDMIQKIAPPRNGWEFNTSGIGVYGDDYLRRAVVALAGLGANLPQDAIYPLAVSDADGKPVVAEGRYQLHFPSDGLPPVGAFWSLTLYDAEGYQVANPLNRFAIGDRDPLSFNADGSLDLYVQHDSPGSAQEANWLPAPTSGALGLTMRLYAPKPEVMNGAWSPPPLRRVG